MTLSVRAKLFLTLSGLVLFFVLVSLGLTRLGLEKYYTWQKKNSLITNSQAIADSYRGDPEEVSLELERTASNLGASILILTKDRYIKYGASPSMINQKSPDRQTNPGPAEAIPFRVPRNPLPSLRDGETVDAQTAFEMHQDPDLKIDFMIIERKLNNGDILSILQPLAPISESAAVAAQFMVFTGLLSILGGNLWAFFFARKFTSPILELSRIAQSMSRLDFTEKCTIRREDEIGELGQSINHLSDQLDAAITELNKKNRQLMADVEKERQLDKMRKDFVSSVSHELKTPLALILGYAEGLKENVAQDEERRNYYASVIMDEAEKMDKLVKDLLNLSQIESGFFQLNKTDFDLSLLLNDVVLKYRSFLAEKAITLESDYQTGLLVNGDALRVEQVLLNLLHNAIDHADFSRTIRIAVQDTGDKARVFVYNSGQPIPEESLEKIWTSFYKVDKARTREYDGYGLGLSIVRAIQTLYGNGYGVENVPSGVKFWFDLDKAKLQ